MRWATRFGVDPGPGTGYGVPFTYPTVSATTALTGEFGEVRRLPSAPVDASRPRHSPPAAGSRRADLWIPAVSHLPTLREVVDTSRRGAQILLSSVALVALVASGILGWDLWGSGWYASRAQVTLAAELIQAAPAAAVPVAPPPAPPDPAVAPTIVPGPAPIILADSAPFADGAPVGRIVIPAIGVDEAFVYGTGVPDLMKGPGLWKWGVLPGEPGNAMISGHRTTYGAPYRHIDQLVPGDRITITMPGRPDAVYEVRGTQVVAPSDVSVSDQVPGVRLTMTACNPVGSARERIVVQSELIEGTNAVYAVPAPLWTFQS